MTNVTNDIWVTAIERVHKVLQLRRVLQDEADALLDVDDALLDRLCAALGLDERGDVPLPPELAGLSLTEQCEYVRLHGLLKRWG